jgi:putative glutamine amidotransferase
VRSLDGIFLPGGPDVSPGAYGQECRIDYTDRAVGIGRPYYRPMMMAPDPRRDEFEIALYHAAKGVGLPILGICRGMQLINVAEGGTLHQEVSDVATLMHELDSNGYNHHHPVTLRESTCVYDVLQVKTCFSPSIHHQAVDRPGRSLVVSGTASDGVIEFIEHEDPSVFVVGIQGDIERARRNHEGFDKLYQRFVDECRRRRSLRES